MANIYEQITLYEDNILQNIALFIKRLTGLEVFVIGKPFIKPDGPYMGLRIVSSDDSGGWSQTYSFSEESFSYLMDNKYEIELVAFRGRPMTMMTYILAALRGAQELKYQYLYTKGISFLSATNIAEANTVMDGDKTEQRARIFLTFNTTMVVEDLPTTEIDSISLTINSYENDNSNLEPTIQYPIENEYVVPHDRTTLYYPTYSGGSIIKYPKDNSLE